MVVKAPNNLRTEQEILQVLLESRLADRSVTLGLSLDPPKNMLTVSEKSLGFTSSAHFPSGREKPKQFVCHETRLPQKSN